MDELTKSLATSFGVSNEPNTTAAQHPRYSQYKEKKSGSDQHARRRNILSYQKSQRFDYLTHVRRLTENFWEGAEHEQHEKMDTTSEPRARRPGKHYKDQLMLSEWLVEVPEDFEEEWVMVPCPVGQRTLIVASMGRTAAYTKSGYCTNTFPSILPGGSKRYSKKGGGTILDCVYNKVTRTYYVLDLMCWNGQSMYDSETEFRFYWINTKFTEEVPEAKTTSKLNPFPFEVLPNFACTKSNIGQVLSSTMNIELDGLLFYHKRTHYTFGSTPLVGWLKAYMMPEILDIPVPEALMDKKPANYTTFEKHNEEVAKAKEEGAVWLGDKRQKQPPSREKHREKKGSAMEVSSDKASPRTNQQQKKGSAMEVTTSPTAPQVPQVLGRGIVRLNAEDFNFSKTPGGMNSEDFNFGKTPGGKT